MRWHGMNVVYQPIFDLQSMNIMGYEALLRGPAKPSDLFAAAEHAHCAAELDGAVRRLAVRMSGDVLPDGVPLWLNVHPAALLDPDEVLSVVPRHRSVVWEMPENAVDERAYEQFLSALADNGHRWAMDDVGQGQADLSRLARRAPSYLKLARWWVVDLALDPHRQALLRALVSFAHERGMQVIAEGVERGTELRAVMRMGVDAAQGYFLARPSPRARGLSRAAGREWERMSVSVVSG